MALPPHTPDTPPPAGPHGEGAGQSGDPSMEDILASIRRILSEDDAGPPPALGPVTTGPADPSESVVLTLQESMIVAEPTPPPAAPPEPPAAGSISAMLRTLIAEREQVPVHRGGPTIEDLVRAEIRPLVQQWLDANLPPIVERLVRAEIERVVGRAIS